MFPDPEIAFVLGVEEVPYSTDLSSETFSYIFRSA
jgi:hypothetical protein